jgi:peptidoglycan L-alanyl-D-glutamate endopeptidase CwlK
MPKYSQRSLDRLSQVDPRLIHIFTNVVKYYDNTILTGHRGQEEQTAHYEANRSKVQWPNSKHNKFPSLAVDAAPYPIPDNWGADHWKDMVHFYMFGAIVLYEAKKAGVTIRWGADWDRDGDFKDNRFNDLVHFEIVEDN